MMKQTKLLSVFLGWFFIFALFACKTGTESSPAVGSLVRYEGCKSFNGGNDGFRTFPQNQECLEYSAAGELLTLKHVNGAFNCCPGDIFAEVHIEDGVITIEEREKEAGCFCLCLFDLDYEIRGLSPGVYTINIVGPYMNNRIFTCTVDLVSSGSGCCCMDRNTYPWL